MTIRLSGFCRTSRTLPWSALHPIWAVACNRGPLSARANGSAHVGVVPLQPFAKAEPPACSDLEVDPVRPQRAPGGDPAIGGDHHAVDEAGSAEPVEADAQIRLLHDQQRGVAAADSQEIGAAEEHGVVAE